MDQRKNPLMTKGGSLPALRAGMWNAKFGMAHAPARRTQGKNC